ncbi:MAG TPA: SDR family oxidoreductase [Gemmatimonadaceae bacterium]
MILVTGATGTVGSLVVRVLRDSGVPVRAFVRDGARATELLGADVALAVGDFDDAASVRRALDAVDVLLLSSANGPRQAEHETGVVDAAAAAGVRRIVKLSTIGARPGSSLAFWDAHGRSEEHLRRSSVSATILRSNFYMSNLLASAASVRGQGRLFAPAGTARVAMIDPRDVAAVAVLALTTEGSGGETHVLTGPEAITYERVAADLSLATGRDVEFVDVPDEAARRGFAAAGMPAWLGEQLLILFRLLRSGAAERATGTVRELTGREPRPFARFARDHAATFGAVRP